jgi:hypothetical protein
MDWVRSENDKISYLGVFYAQLNMLSLAVLMCCVSWNPPCSNKNRVCRFSRV